MSRSRKADERRRELLQQLADAGRRMSDAAVLFHTALAEKLSLGASDWKTLGLLERHGALTAGELAEHTGLAPASVTGIIDRLEQGGWVRRRRDPVDGRRVVIEMDRGVLKNMGPFFAGLLRRLDELYARYSEEELELIVEVLVEIAERQMAAAVELQAVRRGRGRGAGLRGGSARGGL
jgi:DNA-binding MarR family transcriptional regulator